MVSLAGRAHPAGPGRRGGAAARRGGLGAGYPVLRVEVTTRSRRDRSARTISWPGLAAGIWPSTARPEPDGEISIRGVPAGEPAVPYGAPPSLVCEADGPQ